jgi:hypothetical protein
MATIVSTVTIAVTIIAASGLMISTVIHEDTHRGRRTNISSSINGSCPECVRTVREKLGIYGERIWRRRTRLQSEHAINKQAYLSDRR